MLFKSNGNEQKLYRNLFRGRVVELREMQHRKAYSFFLKGKRDEKLQNPHLSKETLPFRCLPFQKSNFYTPTFVSNSED